MTKYLVSEEVEIDGGYGDANLTAIPLAVFDYKDKAKRYAKKYSRHVGYDGLYTVLYCGDLIVDSIKANPTDPPCDLPNYEDGLELKW